MDIHKTLFNSDDFPLLWELFAVRQGLAGSVLDYIDSGEYWAWKEDFLTLMLTTRIFIDRVKGVAPAPTQTALYTEMKWLVLLFPDVGDEPLPQDFREYRNR